MDIIEYYIFQSHEEEKLEKRSEGSGEFFQWLLVANAAGNVLEDGQQGVKDEHVE
jgi:hypothetical protein